jgi:hypothetical protein
MAVTQAFLSEQLEIADQLLAGRDRMMNPQELPGAYGRVVKAIDHLLQVMQCEAVLGGGWAVWRHGYIGRVTQDIDVALPAGRVEEFLRVASVAGFDVLDQKPGRWPKLLHKETQVKVDILPEGARPGTADEPAPTTIPAPSTMGAEGFTLRYVNLQSLVELKLAAGRSRDETDVIELLRVNPNQAPALREHLSRVHASYVTRFNKLLARAEKQRDE